MRSSERIRPRGHAAPRGERGAVLIIGLVLLLALTLIGVTAMRGTTMEERMAGNLRDKSLAFEAAEAALRAAEIQMNRDWVNQPISRLPPDCEVCQVPPEDPMDHDDIGAVWESNGGYVQTVTDNVPAGVAADPQYIIEELFFQPDDLSPATFTGVQYYQVTARGIGGSPNAQSILQSTFARRFN